MNSDELKAILAEIGISQVQFARLIDVTPRGVALWLAGDRAIPGPAQAYAQLLRSLPLNLRQVELARAKEGSVVMKNGMYGIWFRTPDGKNEGHGVLTFEDGMIYGVDVGGVSYDGKYTIGENGKATIVVKVTYPPNTQAVFGASYPFEWSIDVQAELDPKVDRGTTIAQTSLGPNVRLTTDYQYMRALPVAA